MSEKSKFGKHKKLVLAVMNEFGDRKKPHNDKSIEFSPKSIILKHMKMAAKHIHPDHVDEINGAIKEIEDSMTKKSTTVKEAIDASIMKQTALMKEKFEAALFEKAAEQLAEKKIQVAEKYFR